MNKHLSYLWSLLLVCFAACFASTSALASHLRGTTVSWSPTATPGTVQFTIQYAQRTSAGGCSDGSCAVGSTINVPFSYGDGTSDSITATVTSVNSAEDYFSATGVTTHTYAGAGPYTASYDVCCRISTIKSGANDDLRMETLVTPFASPVNHSPVSSMPAIVTVPLQGPVTFNVNAADQDRDTLTYRLATVSEMYNLSSFACAAQQPPGLSINSNTGQVTWDTTQITQAACSYAAPAAGDLWTVQFMIEDRDANGNVKSKVPLDLILKFVASTQPAPTLTFSNPGPITVTPGMPVTFSVGGGEAASNSRITLNVSGLPVGATATNTNQALIPPVSSVVNWTPTTAQAGSYVITYTATNDTFGQVIGSVVINVQSVVPPTATCPASLTAQYNASTAIPVQFSDAQGEALSVNWSVDGNAVQTDTIPASNTGSTLTLNQVFATLGAHTVSVTATNTDNASSTCSTPVTVTAADQTISFAVLPDMSYGDADTVLGATGSSGLAVTYTATGACTIVNGAVHASGTGLCTITAAQAGNANYNAAQAVVRSFNVGPRALTVTAQSASRQYGQANPTFTGTITGIVNNDDVSAAYSSPATTASAVGTYPITPVLSGAAIANYTVTSNNGALTVSAADQNISFGSLTDATYGDADKALSASGTSGLPVSFAATGSCTIANGAVHSIGAGLCTVTATQAGNTSYKTAQAVVRTFNVAPRALTVTAADATRQYAIANPAFTGTITGIVNDDSISATYSSPATASSGVGKYAIVPALAGTALSNYSVTANNGTLTIVSAEQQISFTSLPNVTYGEADTLLNATGTSGLPVSYTAAGNCVVLNGTIHVTGVGTCTVTAAQTGSTFYKAAPEVTRVFSIAPRTLTVDAANATRQYGAANPELGGAITGVANNDAITATYTTPANTNSAAGKYPIVPALSGEALGNYTVVSNNGTMTVTPTAVAGVALTATSNKIFFGSTVTFTATVAGKTSTPTGSITFLDGDNATPLGTVQLNAGAAQLAVSTLSIASHSITAVYSGDQNFTGATSSAMNEVVADFTLNVSVSSAAATSQTVLPGGTGVYNLTITPTGMPLFPNDVALTLSGLPTGATYSFSPATISAGTGTAQVVLKVNAPAATAKLDGSPMEKRLAPFAMALLLLPFSGRMRKRAGMLGRLGVFLIAVAGAVGVAGLTGCGSQNGFLGQPQKTYTLTVTGNSGALSHSTSVELTVE